ncbi:MAG: tetratricopeptide repeat protein [Anaerolineales bacterium]|jgi:tetratricopeptide (TPR) repeat protein
MAGKKEIFQQAMSQGHSAAWDQNWDQASGFYRHALDEFPDHPGALTSLGLALFELEEYEESLKCYVKATEISPSDPFPYEKIAHLHEILDQKDRAQALAFKAAELYLKNKDVNKALENWIWITQLNPKNLHAHSRLAVVYERLGRQDQAVLEYITIASIFQSANDNERAWRSVNHALQISPGNPQALDAITRLRESKSLPIPHQVVDELPVEPLEPALQLEMPEEASDLNATLNPVEEARQIALSVMAGVLFEDPEEKPTEEEAKRGFRAIMRGTGSLIPKNVDRNRVILHIAQVVDLQPRGEVVRAADELERAMDVGLDHPAAYFDLGLMRAQSDRLESALRNLQYAVQHPDYAIGARLLLGDTLRKMGRLNEASVEYMEALRWADAAVVPEDQADDLRELYDPLVEAQSQVADKDAHEQLCENISEILMQPRWRVRLRSARQQLPSQANGGPPVPLAEILTQARSSNIVGSISTIHELDQAGLFHSAMEEAFFALQFAPTYLPLHAYMGELLLKQDQVQPAIDKFHVVAKSFHTRGEGQRSIDFYRRIVELTPLEIEPRISLIEQLVALDQIEEALTEYMDFAEIYYRMADLDRARSTYNEALTLAQQSNVDIAWRIRILHRIADIDQQSLDWRQALRIYEQIRLAQPDDDKARLNIVDLNFRLGQEDKALTELDNFCIYLQKMGNDDASLAFLENLVREDPERVIVRHRLAQQYHKLGRTEEAIAQLAAVVDILADNDNREGAIQVLQAILALKPDNAVEYQNKLKQFRGY